MKKKHRKKLERITAQMLLKRWEKFDISRKDLIHLINEGVLLDRHRKKIEEELLWCPPLSEDDDLNSMLFDVSHIDEMEDGILRTLSPFEFQRKPEEAKDPEEKAVDDDKIEDIEEVQKIESATAQFDQAVLDLIKDEPNISKAEMIRKKKHLYPTNVTDGAIRKHLKKLLEKHGLYKREQPGVKKRTQTS